MSVKKFAAYEDCMARFTISNPGLFQPEEISERASDLVMNAITRFPQDNEGAATIIADQLLENFAAPSRSATGIGIREMANLIPNASYCTQKTSRIHDSFDISAQITPDRVAALICNFAVNALVVIEQATHQEAKRQNAVLPATVARGKVYNDPGSHMPMGPWAVNRDVATALHHFLSTDTVMQTAVAEDVKSRAQPYRATSRAQHAKMTKKAASLMGYSDIMHFVPEASEDKGKTWRKDFDTEYVRPKKI